MAESVPTEPKVSQLEPMAVAICGLLYPRHYREWEELVFSSKRLLIQSARDHGKTTFFSILYPLYTCARKPGTNVCIISYSEKQATDIITAIKTLVEQKPVLRQLKPPGQDAAWSKTELAFRNGSHITCQSFGGAVRGGHYDLVVIDDPVKDFGGMNVDEQWSFYSGVIVPTVKPSGQLIVVGTPVFWGDLIERMESIPVFVKAKFPALDDSGNPLWPERLPRDVLEFKKQEMDDHFTFAREYLLRRISPDSKFFKKEWFRFYETAPQETINILSVDPAISAQGDRTALVVTGTDVDNKTYVLQYEAFRTEDVSVLVDKLLNMATSWSVRLIIIESVGFQRMIKHWLHEEMRKRNTFFGVEEIKTQPKAKEARIMTLQPRVQAGALLLPAGDRELLNELLAFPNAPQDDLSDSLALQVGYWDSPKVQAPTLKYGTAKWWETKIPRPRAAGYFDFLFSDMRSPTHAD